MEDRIIFDGRKAVFGRIASEIAKELLKGKKVDVINVEEIVVSGSKNLFVEKILRKRRMGRGGSLKGPKYIRQEDLLVKRMIRGMLPRDRKRGVDAFKRLKCYIGSGEFSEEELKNVRVYNGEMPREYNTIKEIVRSLK